MTTTTQRQHVLAITQLMRMDKPIGTLLLLWPTLWALWLASRGTPDLRILMIFISGTFLMRSAGCVINDLTDRKFDQHVERTKQRPLARGATTPTVAVILAIFLLGFALTGALFLNWLTIKLAFIGAALAILYPWMKRFTYWPQAFLGLAFAWGIPMAYAAVQNRVPFEAWWLFAATYCWIMAYDTLYALADKEDDQRIGVKSTALRFGRWAVPFVLLFQALFMLLLFLLGLALKLPSTFNQGLVMAGLLIFYQTYLAWQHNPESCFKAFLNNNWIGFAVFIGFISSLGGAW